MREREKDGKRRVWENDRERERDEEIERGNGRVCKNERGGVGEKRVHRRGKVGE